MLTPSDYIVKELEQMNGKFNDFDVLYAFDQRVNAHIIQISQIDKFRDSEELLDWEVDFIERFEREYQDTLIITEPHSFYDMSELQYSNIDGKTEEVEDGGIGNPVFFANFASTLLYEFVSSYDYNSTYSSTKENSCWCDSPYESNKSLSLC